MSLPIVRWLSRPLARFLRWTVMARARLWTAGMEGSFAGLPRAANKRREVKLSLEMMETRFVPQDVLSIMRPAAHAVGFSVVSSLLLGHDTEQPSLPPAPVTGGGGRGDAGVFLSDNLAQRESLAFLSVPGAPQQTAERALSSPVSDTTPMAPTGNADVEMKDWLADVGNFLAGPAPAPVVSTGAAPATNTGGGEGPSSVGAGLNTTQQAAPMPSGSRNVPDAGTAGQMLQAAAAMNGTRATQGIMQPAAVTGTASAGAGTNIGQASTSTPSTSSVQTTTPQTPPAPTPSFAGNYGQVPLLFEMNAGQSDPSVLALSNGPGFGFWLTQAGMTFSVPHIDAQSGQENGRDVFTLAMSGANTSGSAQVVPSDLQSGRSNYFIGADSSQWISDIPQYGEITYKNAYPGIDLVLHAAAGEGRTFEYDFVVNPGANPESIQLNLEGLQGITTDSQGDLLLGTSGGNVVMANPVLYQSIDGQKQDVAGKYVLQANGDIGFQVSGSYDSSVPLVLDPTVQFSSYIGGTGDDYAYGVAVDADGNTYLTGKTSSSNFPIHNGYQSSGSGSYPYVFVTKLNAQGTGILWSTYLSGTGITGNFGNAIAVDLSGDVYVAGQAASGFPVTSGAYQTTFPGLSTAGFVTKLNGTGDELVYSTYYDGDAISINALAVDSQDQLHLAGSVTNGSTLTTTSGVVQTSFGGGSSDGFAAELNTAGTTQIYATYLGGSGSDGANGIALDSADNVYVVGTTGSSNYPTTTGAYQTSLGGLGTNAFVTKLNSTATTLVYSTYVGSGTATTTGAGIALDLSDRAYITGKVGSHVLVDALNTAGSTLVYSTTLSGNNTDAGTAIAVTVGGAATVVGTTTSTTFPTTTGALQTTLQGSQSAFVAQLSAAGSQTYGSYLGGSTGGGGFGLGGGSTSTTASAVALNPLGAAYVAGWTNATNFPTAGTPYQSSNAGGNDAFLAQFVPGAAAPHITGITPVNWSSGNEAITSSQNLTITGTATPSTTVTLERADLGVLGSTSVSSGGTWSYNYTSVTLPQGGYDFIARDVNAAGAKSAYSADYLVTVDLTGPTVTLSVTSTTRTLSPQVTITVKDQVGIPATTTAMIYIAPSSTGPWTGYSSVTINDGFGQGLIPAVSGPGTYWLQATVDDSAAMPGASAPESFIVSNATSWISVPKTLSADPVDGNALLQMGVLQFSHPLDLDQSPGTRQGGNPALVYDSGQVSQQPIVRVELLTPNNASLPSPISAQLWVNGYTGGAVNFSTSGFTPGDDLTLALQSSTTITTTGRYDWSVHIAAGTYTANLSGTSFVVAQDSSTLGAGWSLAGVNQLEPISAWGSDPAGMLMVFGSGGWRFYADDGLGGYTSPFGDNGTLSVSGGTYTYSTPDGQSWTYNSSGLMTQWTSPDGNQTLQYGYDVSDRLTGISAIDGAVTTFSYSSGQVLIQTVNSRVTTLTLDGSNNLTAITDPSGGVETLTYDSNHRLTDEQLGMLGNGWAYNSAGVLDTLTQGTNPTLGSNPSQSALYPAVTQGLGSLVAGTVIGRLIDPVGAEMWAQMTPEGRPLAMNGGDNGTTYLSYSGNDYFSGETDPLGRTTTYTLDAEGYPTAETFPDGSVVTLQYQTAFHALTTMTDERGETTTFAYDAAGHVTGMTDALGKHTTYGYYSNGLVETVTDANNHTTTYAYDSDERLSTVKDATGATTTYNYDANGNLSTITDPLGRVTTYSNDVMGDVVNTTDPSGGVTTYTWDVTGLELSATDPMGVTMDYVYDSLNRGLLVETIVGAGSAVPVTTLNTYDAAEKLVATRDENGATTTYVYDPAGNVVNTTDALGDTTQYDYNLAGEQYASRDPMGNWTQYSYNVRGWLTQVQDALGNVSTLAYDATGNETAVTDPLGHSSTYTYDAVGQQTVGEDPLGHLVTTTYDPVGNVSALTNANGVTTSYTYDADNRPTGEVDAVGTSVQRSLGMGYDAAGNVTTLTDGNSHVTTLAYDTLDRLTSVTDALSHVSTLSYNAVSELTGVTNALNHTGTLSYDAIESPIAGTDPLGHTGTVVLDGAGDSSATIDPLGNVTVSMIDLLGRTVGSVDALGNVTQTVLDPNGNVRMVVDPDGNETHYVNNRDGQATETITPLGTTTMAYDAAGRLTQTTDADGRVIQYSYDVADRLTGEVWKNASAVTVNVVTYSYDNIGNMLTAADYNGTVTYSYDALDRVQSYTNVFGLTLTYSYDANDNLTQRTDSLGGTLTYVYDNANRLTSEQFTGTGATGTTVRVDFGYDAANEQTSTTWYSNLTGTSTVAASAYSYDNAGRLTSIVNTNSSSVTHSYYTYTYDNADRVSAQTHWSQVGTTTYSGTNTYSYDAINQLLADGTATYSYDANGNRTMAGYSTGSDNEMSSDGTYTYTYDAVGNLTQKTTGSGSSLVTWTYSYDNANELTGIVETGSSGTMLQITYMYDVLRPAACRSRYGSRVRPQRRATPTPGARCGRSWTAATTWRIATSISSAATRSWSASWPAAATRAHGPTSRTPRAACATW